MIVYSWKCINLHDSTLNIICRKYENTTINEKTFFSIFFSNSEANASELLENLEYMFPRHYMLNCVFDMFKSSTTHQRVSRCQRTKCIMYN